MDMCRLLAYVGQPALLAEVVLWPDRSIIIQSFDARERKQDPNLPQHVGFGNLNGDGFGIGWYADSGLDDRKPCVFTSVTPAWSVPLAIYIHRHLWCGLHLQESQSFAYVCVCTGEHFVSIN